MEIFFSLIIPLLLLAGLIRVITLPIRLVWKILINALCGFLCLWLLNTVSGYTGIVFPINAVTVTVAGLAGLPGILLLAAVQLLL